MTKESESLADSVRARFHDQTYELQRYFYLCRAREVIVAALESVRELKGVVAEAKQFAIEHRSEDFANEMLAYEYACDALASELQLYLALKNDDSAEAWGHLVGAQMAAKHAVQSHKAMEHLSQIYIPRLHQLERLLFPVQLFMSVGTIVQEARCSICDAEYGDCDHIKGRPYMGDLCSVIIAKMSVREVSIVLDPADKTCRIHSFSGTNGTMLDSLSLRPIPEAAPEATKVEGEKSASAGGAQAADLPDEADPDSIPREL